MGSLYALLFRIFNVAVTPLSLVLSVSPTGVSMLPLSRISYPLIPALAMNLPDHIRHFSFSPVRGIIQMLFSSILYFLVSLPERDRSLRGTSKYVGRLQ